MDAENNRFNTQVYINLTYIERDPALHIVDNATRFCAAYSVEPLMTESVWEPYLPYGKLLTLDC